MDLANDRKNIVSTLERYQSKTIKDYAVIIEYKHLAQHVPSGIYILPSFDDARLWYGVIFIRSGHYRDGVFKFILRLPQEYNDLNTYPDIRFTSRVYHPYVDPASGELNLRIKIPEWNPELHYLVTALVFLKGIFYQLKFPPASALASVPKVNQSALALYHVDRRAYEANVQACVQLSLAKVYENPVGSSLCFSTPAPAHETLRQSLFGPHDGV